VARAVHRGGAAEDREPAADQRDPRQHGGEDHEQAGVELLVEGAGDDQGVGDERQRPGEAERRQAEEEEEQSQGRRVVGAPLVGIQRHAPRPALDRPGDRADAGQRQPGADPHRQRPAQLGRQRPGQAGEDQRRLAHRQRPHQTAQVALDHRQRRAVGGRH
jgi:hypothetical protein